MALVHEHIEAPGDRGRLALEINRIKFVDQGTQQAGVVAPIFSANSAREVMRGEGESGNHGASATHAPSPYHGSHGYCRKFGLRFSR